MQAVCQLLLAPYGTFPGAQIAALSVCVCRPDRSGNRYCINLVCVAGEPVEADVAAAAGGEEQAEDDGGHCVLGRPLAGEVILTEE